MKNCLAALLLLFSFSINAQIITAKEARKLSNEYKAKDSILKLVTLRLGVNYNIKSAVERGDTMATVYDINEAIIKELEHRGFVVVFDPYTIKKWKIYW
jgi:hypothetical protein